MTSRSDMTAWWHLGGLVVAKKPYLMQTVRLALRLEYRSNDLCLQPNR